MGCCLLRLPGPHTAGQSVGGTKTCYDLHGNLPSHDRLTSLKGESAHALTAYWVPRHASSEREALIQPEHDLMPRRDEIPESTPIG